MSNHPWPRGALCLTAPQAPSCLIALHEAFRRVDMKITSNSWVFLSTAFLFLGALPQSALAIRYDQKYIEAIKKSEGITPIGVDSFGENLDISSGSVEFKWTDIDIPGNNALPVAALACDPRHS